jgi:hypothetical protein
MIIIESASYCRRLRTVTKKFDKLFIDGHEEIGEMVER